MIEPSRIRHLFEDVRRNLTSFDPEFSRSVKTKPLVDGFLEFTVKEKSLKSITELLTEYGIRLLFCCFHFEL